MSQRILKLNGEYAEIDADTSIGITIQAYDFKEPGNSRVTISNSFSIPYTLRNKNLLGDPYNPQSTDLTIYSELDCEYFVDNERYIFNALARIESIDGRRISLFVYEKNTFFDEMRKVKLDQFIYDYIVNVYRPATPTDANTSALFSRLCGGGNEIVRLFATSGFAINEESTVENPLTNTLDFTGSGEVTANALDQIGIPTTGQLFIKVKPLFEYIETVFDVDLGLGVADTLGTDTFFNSVLMRASSLSILNNDPGKNTGAYQGIPLGQFGVIASTDGELNYIELKDSRSKNAYGDATVYDFFNIVLQQFGSYISKFGLDGDFILTKLDKIFDLKDSQGLSFADSLLPGLPDATEKYTMSPIVGDFSQQSRILVANPQDGVSPLEGGTIIEGFNMNLDGQSDLFETDIYQAGLVTVDGVKTDYLSFSDEKSLDSLCFVIPTVETKNVSWNVFYRQVGITLVVPPFNQLTNVAAQFALGGEYELFRRIAAYPVTIKEKRWVTPEEMRGFRTYTPYYDARLGGWLFVNGVSNFNPAKSKEGAEFELIKIRSLEVEVNESITTWNYYNSGGGNAVQQGTIFQGTSYRLGVNNNRIFYLNIVLASESERAIFLSAKQIYTVTDPGGAQTVFNRTGEDSGATQYIKFEVIASTVDVRIVELRVEENNSAWPANTASFSMRFLDPITNTNIYVDLTQTINIDTV